MFGIVHLNTARIQDVCKRVIMWANGREKCITCTILNDVGGITLHILLSAVQLEYRQLQLRAPDGKDVLLHLFADVFRFAEASFRIKCSTALNQLNADV